ncbi:hypothetical protein ACJW31_09G024900 [Castanea mollissima]
MNNELMMDSPQDEVHTLQFPPKVQMESITKKTQRVVSSRQSAWLNISVDAVRGNEQKHKTYWNRVLGGFNKEKTFASTRNANSLMNSRSTIQLHTNKFVGFLASIEMTNPSGVNEQNKINKSKEAYLKVQNTAFRFDRC